MKPLSVPPGTRRLGAAVAGVVLLAGLLPAQANAAPEPAEIARQTARDAQGEGPANYDSRDSIQVPPAAAAARRAAAAARPGSAVRALRDKLGVQGIVEIDKATGTPRRVARTDGFLTAKSSKKPAAVALDYVRANTGVFGLDAAAVDGLVLRKDYVDVEGTHHLSFVQTVDGVTVFGNGLKAHVADDGRLIQIDGAPLAALPAAPGTAKLTAAKAREAAVADVFGDSTAKVRGAASGAARTTTFTDGGNAKLVMFQTAAGPRLAWQVIAVDEGYIHVVDAAEGTVLFRQSTVAHDTGKAFPNYPGAPAGGTQRTVNLTRWLPVGSPKLSGNVAHVYSDVNDDNEPNPAEEVAPKAKRNFEYPFTDFTAQAAETGCTAQFKCSWDPKEPYSWRVNRAQNAVQMYYFLGTFHDHLRNRPIGFTRAAGNFEAVDGDAVQGEAMDGADVAEGLPDADHDNNANMNTPPDGIPPRMQMYLFREPFIAGNSGDEAAIVYHEYGHGLSNRLVTDANGLSTLGDIQGRAMGEAWSDWYAMDYLVDEGLERDTRAVGDVLVGKYVTAGGSIRYQALDCPVGSTAENCAGSPGSGAGGFTYGDFGRIYPGGVEEHADGEIWTQTLWDLRKAVGSAKAQSLITRGMELAPANPSFLDMRNSILQADLVVNDGKQQKNLWKIFAARGMGYFAAALDGDDAEPAEDFSLPPAAGTPRGTLTGTVTDADTGAPAAGVQVGFGGHASGFAGDYADTTDADGTYTITGIIPGTYAKVFARGAGYDPKSLTLSIASRTQSQNWALRRDWAAISGGSDVVSFTGPDYSEYGCGPAQLFDQSQSAGWGSDVAPEGQNVVVQLPVAVDIAEVVINPSATCGDDPTASTSRYRVETSGDGTTWTVGAEGAFPNGTVTPTTVPLSEGSRSDVAFLRYTMLTTQGQDAGLCPAGQPPTVSGCLYLDSTELAVYGAASS
ncbi:M36 family metallopeptidase [Jidongwangia harbinensis]|uniref:M36 family metallopeptidase n=1 Tax=Jidongwangia harbinensis TaxID=2878561 RepID=UPI001CD9CD5E|nr:M36 family metallopeptidase [Jidongwangia harbinensis]MCA2212402.1 M36 family metallopeptidase [Jidongwangia harbinensis]